MRFRAFVPVLLSPVAVACAHAPPPQPPAPPAQPPPAVAVAYRLVRSGDGEGVVLSGKADLDPGGAARVEAVAPHHVGEARLELRAHPGDAGSLLVRVHYEEMGPEGAALKWEPEIRLARGATARADVTGVGWGRAIELTVQ